MLTRRVIFYLGLSQLICWGVCYYLIGGFGAAMVADLGWSSVIVYGGFSVALLVMGLTSPLIGRLIDRHGGRPVMAAGSLCAAAGCLALSASHQILPYYLAWALLGLAMRLTLYEAGFATLARLGGREARAAMSQITLLGGLASTCFWPIGHALASAFGWRGALVVYAGLALLTLPLHLAIPRGRFGDAGAPTPMAAASLPTATTPPPTAQYREAAWLYATICALISLLNAAMSAHMIPILGGLGLGAGIAVTIASLRGIGQSSARACEILFGRRLDPIDLNLLALGLLPIAFLAGCLSGQSTLAAGGFALLYGAANGLATITRGTLPLVLFDHNAYGRITGRLLVPSFISAALAPLLYAAFLDRFGARAGLILSLGLTLIALAAALRLRWRRRHLTGAIASSSIKP
jgi:MFS family permease